MFKTKISWGVLAIALVGVAGAVGLKPCPAEAQFYKGKSVRMLVGYRAGGGNDTRTRFVARYMEKYIPGNPKIIVENMPGGSGVVEVNYLYNVAKHDGLILGNVSREAALVQMGEQPGVKYDITKFEWLGALVRQPLVVFIRSSLPYHSIDDIKRGGKPLIFAARRVGASNYIAAKGLELLGVPVKIVLGYGGRKLNLAFENGEVEASSLSMSSFEKRAHWVKPGGLARMLVTFGDVREKGVAFGPSLKPKTGSEALYKMINASLGMPLGTFAAPPGTSADRMAELRTAFAAMTDDPQFRKDAKKLRLPLQKISGREIQGIFADFINSPPEAKKVFKSLLK
jgi:tripartite-type tricarboxylate transporter receptor subunit TctC